MPTIMAVIPARGGSKGLPGKNIMPLCGKPLIAHTISAAKDSGVFSRIIVSTEDNAIAKVAVDFGAEVPFLRPRFLAQDETPTIPVLQDLISKLADTENYQPDLLVLLQPTSPLRNAAHITAAIKQFVDIDADSLISVCEMEHHPYWAKVIQNGLLKDFCPSPEKIQRRQDLPVVYRPNGAIYIYRVEKLMTDEPYGDRIAPFIMPWEDSVDIDTWLDFKLAELIMLQQPAK